MPGSPPQCWRPFILCIPLLCLAAGPNTVQLPAEGAWDLLLRNQPAAAADSARTLLVLHPGDARAAYCLAAALLEQGDSTALARLRGGDPALPPGLGLDLLIEAMVAGAAENWPRAESLLAEAAARGRAAADPRAALLVHEQRALVRLAQGKLPEALGHAERAFALAESLSAPLAAAHAQLIRGRALKDLARREGGERAREAEEVLQAAIEAADRVGAPFFGADARQTLSILARWRQDLDRALTLRQEALDGFREAGRLGAQAGCLQRIAAIHLMRGELSTAMRLLQEAWDLAKGIRGRGLTGWILLNLGGIHYLAGEVERADELLAQAIVEAVASEDRNLEAAGRVNRALVLIERGASEEALGELEEALAICRATHDRRGEVRTLNNLGFCRYLRGEPAQAIEHLEAALGIARETGGVGTSAVHLQRDLGLCRVALKEWDAAREALRAAQAGARQLHLPTVLTSIQGGLADVALAEGDTTGALGLLRAAVDLQEGLRGQWAGTARIERSFSGRRSVIYDRLVGLLHDLDRSDPGAGHGREAFAVAQQARGRALLDLLSEAEVDLRPHAGEELQRAEREYRAALTTLLAPGPSRSAEDSARALLELTRLEEAIPPLEADLRAADPRYAALRYPKPWPLERVQGELLGPADLLLLYLLGEERSFLWVVDRTQARCVTLPARAQIEDAARALLPLLHDYNLLGREAAYYVEPARRLGAMLLDAVGDPLATARHLIIVPDGVLHYLPFEALLLEGEPVGEPGAGGSGDALSVESAGDRGAQSFARLPFLIRDYSVSYVPAVSILGQLRTRSREAQRPRASAQVVLFGDPTPAPEGTWSLFAQAVLGPAPRPLVHAGEELDALRELLRVPAEACRTGDGATPRRLAEVGRGGVRGLVHIAAHGVFNERRPRYSGLVLAADSSDGSDGFLALSQVYALELPCDLLTLSSCSSALGEEITGEGLLGLTQAFLYAGARSVVAALWEVAGHETALFMKHFYRDLAPALARSAALAHSPASADRSPEPVDLPVAEALAAAKRALIREAAAEEERAQETHAVSLAHPYFWAPYVATGAGR